MTYPCDTGHEQLDVDKPFIFGGFEAYKRNKAGLLQALRDEASWRQPNKGNAPA